MTIFVVLMPEPQAGLVDAIRKIFPNDHITITDTQWLISSSKTVIDITSEIGIFDARNPDAQPTGNAIVFAIASYYGRAPAHIWDWIRSKLESPSRV